MSMKRKKNPKHFFRKVTSLPDLLNDLDNNVETEIEIIIVVNGTKDKKLLDFVQTRKNDKVIINSHNVGVARAWNMGRHMAEGDYLLYLNDDVQVHPGSIEKMLEVYKEEPNAGNVGPQGSRWENFAHAEFMGTEKREVSTVVSGFAFMVRTETYDKIGGFDDFYTPAGFEEIDFCYQINKLGLHCIVDPDINITTEPRHGISALNTNIKYLNSEINTKDLNERNKSYFESKWKN